MSGRLSNPVWAIALYIAGVVCAGAAIPGPTGRGAGPGVSEVMCRAELRSWIVAGRGRHLYLDLECPEPYGYLSGRIEFGAASLREDYRAPMERAHADRVSRMSRGVRLMPPAGLGVEDNRLEAVFEVTLAQAECLQRDRMWSERYVLIGANSNSAMLATLTECDCGAPERVLRGAGVFGEFPGVDAGLGVEIEAARWSRFGVRGPTEASPLIEVGGGG